MDLEEEEELGYAGDCQISFSAEEPFPSVFDTARTYSYRRLSKGQVEGFIDGRWVVYKDVESFRKEADFLHFTSFYQSYMNYTRSKEMKSFINNNRISLRGHHA